MRHLILAACLACAAPAVAAPPLVVALGPAPERGFDPLFGWGETGDLLIQSTLWRRDVDGAPIGELATGWTLSDDRLGWTITLRGDARFSDGRALTSADVAATFNAALTTGTRDMRPLIAAAATGPLTVTLTLSTPAISFTEQFYTLGIMPADRDPQSYGQNPVGSGPYMLDHWRAGEQLTLTANPHYFGDAPAFERITFLLADDTAGLMAARAGAAQLVHLPLTASEVSVAGMSRVERQTVDNRGISLPMAQPHDVDGKRIGNAVTSDPAIRAALNLGFDRDMLVAVGLGGHGRPAFGPGDRLAWDGEIALPTDQNAAMAGLDAAGWITGPDGIRVKDGISAEFPLYYPSHDPLRQKLAELVALLAQPLGIAVTPRGANWEEIARVMAAEPVVFGFGTPSPRQIAELFQSDLAGVAWSNPTHYANPAVDALIARAEAAPDLPSAHAIWQETFAHTGLQGDQPWAWLVNIDHLYLADDCLDLGPARIEPHMHGWPLTEGIRDWRWTCD